MFMLVLTGACSQAHTGVGGVDADRRMVDLTDDEWQALCQWYENQAPMRTPYECDGRAAFMSPTTMCPAGDLCYTYYWSATRCLLTIEANLFPTDEARARWTSAPSDCAVTVQQFAACVQARAGLVCWEAFAQPPECAAAMCNPASVDGGLGDAAH
jgi:hypothetical protein